MSQSPDATGRGATVSPQSRFTRLWRHGDFLKLWTGQAVSIFGVLMGALQFTAILVLNAQPLQMGLLTAAGVAPGVLFGLAAGVWVDRLRRRPILIGADVVRGLMMASIPAAHFLGVLRLEQLYVVAFANGAFTVCFDVAHRSYLPSLVGREQLIEANSKLSAGASAVESMAFSLGGWIVQLFGAITATVINGAAFLASAVFLGSIRAEEPAPPPATARPNLFREVVEGLRLVGENRILAPMAVETTARGLAHGIIGATILLFGLRELGIQPGILYMVFAVGGISSLLGALIAARVSTRFGAGPTMVAGAAIAGASVFLIPVAQGPMVLVLGFLVAQQLLGDGAATIREINEISLRQNITRDSALGRVNASIQFLELAATLAGSLVAGGLAEIIGLRLTLAAGAASGLMGALWLAMSPVRRIKQGDAEKYKTCQRRCPLSKP